MKNDGSESEKKYQSASASRQAKRQKRRGGMGQRLKTAAPARENQCEMKKRGGIRK